MSDLYHEVILEEARHPHNHGQMPDADVVLSQSNASCGDHVTIYIKTDANTQVITDLKWDGQGCIISQAAMSLLSQLILENKMTLTEIGAISQQELEKLLGIEEITPGRIKCLMVGVAAFKQAKPISDSKQTKPSAN